MSHWVWQVLLHVFVFGASHCSVPLTQPSPQLAALQLPAPSHRPEEHAEHFVATVPAEHFLPACPFTVTSLHASAPLQELLSLHESEGVV